MYIIISMRNCFTRIDSPSQFICIYGHTHCNRIYIHKWTHLPNPPRHFGQQLCVESISRNSLAAQFCCVSDDKQLLDVLPSHGCGPFRNVVCIDGSGGGGGGVGDGGGDAICCWPVMIISTDIQQTMISHFMAYARRRRCFGCAACSTSRRFWCHFDFCYLGPVMVHVLSN